MVDVPFEGQVLKSRETGHSEMLSILHRFLSRLLIFSLVLKNCLHLLFSVLQLYSSCTPVESFMIKSLIDQEIDVK